MTNDLRITLRQGADSGDFLRLLQNYGFWAHTSGCKGWSHGGDFPTPAISDETALEVDKAVGVLKQTKPQLAFIFTYYYIKQLDEHQIVSILRRRNRRDKDLQYITAVMVRELLKKAEQIVYDALEVNCESVYLQTAGIPELS